MDLNRQIPGAKNILPDMLEIALDNIGDYNLSTLKAVLEFDKRMSPPVNVRSAGGSLLHIDLSGAAISENTRTLTGNRRIRIQLKNGNMVCRNLKVCCDVKGRSLGHLRGRFLSSPVPVSEYCCQSDSNKNITSLTDDAGAVCAAWEYDAYGNIINQTGEKAPVNPLRFSSEYHDEELGLVYYNYRHYNPKEGRWISRDPIEEEGGINLYSFVNNVPTSICDINGEKPDFDLDVQKCMLTMKVKLHWEANGIRKDVAKKLVDKAKEHISAIWNQVYVSEPFSIVCKKPLPNDCPCNILGVMPKVEFIEGDESDCDIFLHFHMINKANATPMDGFGNSVINGPKFNLLPGQMNFGVGSLGSPLTAAHEFGHSLGLFHPGEGIASYEAKVTLPNGAKVSSPYVYRGKDLNGYYVDGNVDLMGIGKGVRDFYFYKWQDYMNEQYPWPKCCYQTIKSLPSLDPVPA